MSLASLNKKKDVPDNVDLAAKTFEQHGDFIRSILHFHVKDNTLSEDLFQDFFLFLILKPIPQDVQNVRGFLYRVVSDKAKDAFRRIKRHQERMRRYADRRKCVIENCPENVMIDVEESERMFELIRQHLPPKEAQAVTLRYRNFVP